MVTPPPRRAPARFRLLEIDDHRKLRLVPAEGQRLARIRHIVGLSQVGAVDELPKLGFGSFVSRAEFHAATIARRRLSGCCALHQICADIVKIRADASRAAAEEHSRHPPGAGALPRKRPGVLAIASQA